MLKYELRITNYDLDFSALRAEMRSESAAEFSRTRGSLIGGKHPVLRYAWYIAMPDCRANTFEKSETTKRMLLWIDIIVDTYQKSWQQAVIMMMVLKKILHRLTIRSKLRNAHIINKS